MLLPLQRSGEVAHVVIESILGVVTAVGVGLSCGLRGDRQDQNPTGHYLLQKSGLGRMLIASYIAGGL